MASTKLNYEQWLVRKNFQMTGVASFTTFEKVELQRQVKITKEIADAVNCGIFYNALFTAFLLPDENLEAYRTISRH